MTQKKEDLFKSEFTENFIAKKAEYNAAYGPARISVEWIDSSENSRAAYIETNNLSLVSAEDADAEKTHEILWGNAEVMKLYGNAEPYSPQRTTERYKGWHQRWKSKDPFSGFVVQCKDGEILGNVVLGYSHEKHYGEFAALYKIESQNKHIGSESMGAVLFDWSEYLVEHNMKIKQEVFWGILATAHTQNRVSNHLLKKAGFTLSKVEEAHEAMRNHYVLEVLEHQDPALGGETPDLPNL